jgi:hypothetical protein
LDVLKIIQEGEKGLYQFYGIESTVRRNGNEGFQFVGARFYNGEEIQTGRYYTGVATDFLLGGGDDFEKVIGKVYQPRDVQDLG